MKEWFFFSTISAEYLTRLYLKFKYDLGYKKTYNTYNYVGYTALIKKYKNFQDIIIALEWIF